MGDHFCLKWNNHQENLTGIMTKLLDEQKFVDVSLVCEMKTFKAHQTVLSACSPYFEQVLEENPHPHPIIILKDVKESEMTALLQYMYRGEVSVRDDELSAFLHTARALKVRGLSDNKKEIAPPPQEDNLPSSAVAQMETVTPPKRPRTSTRSNEQETLEKHIFESESSTASSNICKSSLKPSSNPPAPSAMNYSENSSDVHYSNASTPSQTIKQEVDSISVPNEEPSAISHLGSLEPRTEHCHKISEWNFDYAHPMENRNYQTQKVELPKVPIPMTYNFSSQLQGSSIPGLYPCNSKGKPKKDQPSTSYDPKPKTDFAPGPSTPNHPVSVIKNPDTPEINAQPGGIQRKGGRFRPGWMENYSWLQYDECLNTMYCKTCRKWSSSVPDIRTSFVEGNGNFRLEIVNHHHKSKAHKLCMAKEEESIPRLDPIAVVARYTELQTSTPLNGSLIDSGGTDIFDGSKQWQIKYAFEKVDGIGFRCKICGQIKKHVRNHYLKHFPEHHECHLCRRTYTRKDNLNSHLKRDHFQRAKTPPDPYQRLRRLTKTLEGYQTFKCYTPDFCTQMKFSSPIHGSSIPSQSSPLPDPVDLSIRPSSVPAQSQFAPIYNLLPSFYSYFRN